MQYNCNPLPAKGIVATNAALYAATSWSKNLILVKQIIHIKTIYKTI
jgi:hypothetical protein